MPQGASFETQQIKLLVAQQSHEENWKQSASRPHLSRLGVNFRLLKALPKNEVTKALEPLAGGLFETIYCFVKLENRTLVGRSLHVGWDFQVQLFLQTTM